jgi:hypothetical protein
MQGYVLTFRPGSGDGTIVAESGEEFRFAGAADRAELHGGDIVSFHRPSMDTVALAPGEIRVVRRWPEQMAASQQTRLRELHSTVLMDAPPR